MTAVLAVSNLALVRGGRRLFGGLDFSLSKGELAVLTGSNGSGKTSLLRVLAGLSMPAEGEVQSMGEPAHRQSLRQREQVLFQGHLEGLKQDLSVRENLEFARRLRGLPSVELGTVMADVGLSGMEDRLVRHLSAGQRRRAALAGLALGDPALWLLDEPLTNLDGDGRAVVEKLLAWHLDRGGAAVVATHASLNIAHRPWLAIEL